MVRGKKIVGGVVAAVLAAAGTGLVTATPAQAAGARHTCKAEAHLDLGRPKATSSCQKTRSGKRVGKHRVKLVCDVVRGRGNPHEIPVVLYGPWKKPGRKSTVMCGFSSFARSWSVQTEA